MHATFQHNIAQYCCAQHVAHVWPPCCNMLQHVGWRFEIANQTSAHAPMQQCYMNVAKQVQHHAT